VVVESILTELRTRAGLDVARLAARVGIDLTRTLGAIVAEEVGAGRMATPTPDRWTVTKAGAPVLDAIQRRLHDAYPAASVDRSSPRS
jgi:coproporphyrinogen III oxidase-like Fe-S oxidoreductase